MNNKKELSASALQIAEKKERLQKMIGFASELTREQISDLLKENPSISNEEIVEKLKSEGIPINAFLKSYIKTKYAVSQEIAKDYFETISESLKPNFILFNPSDTEDRKFKPTYFHLLPSHMKTLISDERKEQTKVEVAKHSGRN